MSEISDDKHTFSMAVTFVNCEVHPCSEDTIKEITNN